MVRGSSNYIDNGRFNAGYNQSLSGHRSNLWYHRLLRFSDLLHYTCELVFRFPCDPFVPRRNTMNRMNYVNHIVINYGHIWYIYFIKIFFISALVTILVRNSMENLPCDSICIPLYYNLMLIETLLSSLLITLTNAIVINVNTIKLIQISMA